jgi:hypothetical protein
MATTQISVDTPKRSSLKKNAKPARAAKARAKRKSALHNSESEGLGAQLYRQGREAMSGAYDSASKVGSRASKAMPSLRGNLDLRSRSQSLYQTMEEHPFVIGAVGLGVGMVLAAMLPSVDRLRHRN